MKDPTREEMLACLDAFPFIREFDEFDVEEAIYWFANDYHGGQWSNLYSTLSTSAYQPGPLTQGCQDPTLYDEMVAAFGRGDE